MSEEGCLWDEGGPMHALIRPAFSTLLFLALILCLFILAFATQVVSLRCFLAFCSMRHNSLGGLSIKFSLLFFFGFLVPFLHSFVEFLEPLLDEAYLCHNWVLL